MANSKWFKDGSGLKVKYDGFEALEKSIARLARDEVLVGFPEDTTQRDDPDSKDVTNAALGYIHDNGAPEANIPARPFMIPGITRVMPKVEATLHKMAQYGLAGDVAKIDEGFERIGFLGVDGITSTIREGVPPPLAELTLKKRAAKGRKGAQAELNRRAAGYGPSLQLATPLMDTNEMLKSVTYVVRNRSQRGK